MTLFRTGLPDMGVLVDEMHEIGATGLGASASEPTAPPRPTSRGGAR